MATKKKPVKDKVKAKLAKTKKKVKAKLKGACVAALGVMWFMVGCSTAQPASRATTAQYEIDVSVSVDEKAKAVTVNVPFTIGDGALASADSAGSTETQTATPTVDVKPDIDVRYNDAIAGASAASKGVLETLLASSANKVLALMQSKDSGTVKVTKTDGTTATVQCADGQCSFVDDGSTTTTDE